MARNQASARPAQRKDSTPTTGRGSAVASKKTVQSSAPPAAAANPKPEPVKRPGELPVPRATYFL